MDQHASTILNNDALWKKFQLRKWEAKHPGLITGLLHHLILVSQALGGSFVDEFWLTLGRCHPRLEENICKLNAAPEQFSDDDISMMLFNQVPGKFDLSPIIGLAGEFFTHLGLTVMNPRDDLLDPTLDAAYDQCDEYVEESDSDITSCKEGDELNLHLDIQEVGLSDEKILKYSASNRDGFRCAITGYPLQYPQRPNSGFRPSLIYRLNIDRDPPVPAAVIPISIEESPSALRCITLLAGDSTRQLVLSHLHTVDNMMVVDYRARSKFDQLAWGIEALESKKYVYRRIPAIAGPGPVDIRLRDGDEIQFGLGQDGKPGVGPLPQLCNLRLAIARALRLSGAATLIGKLLCDETIDMSRNARKGASTYYLLSACNL